MPVAVNILAAIPTKDIKAIYWYLGLGVATLFLISILFREFYRIPTIVMRLYKFGNIPTSELVLKTEGCAVFSALDIKIENKKSGLCTTNNILILSRLGRETYLQHSNKDRILKFTITSSNVVSWSLIEGKTPSASNPE